MHPKTIDRFAHVRSILPCPTSQNALLGTFCQVKNSFYFFAVHPDQNNSLTRHYQCHNIIYKMTVVKHPRLFSHKFKKNQTIPVIEIVIILS